MTTARDLLTIDVEFAAPTDSVLVTARRMAELDVGMLPVCDPEHRLVATITDRDLALRVVGEGRDPSATRVDEVWTLGEVVTIRADDPIAEALEVMERHAVRRLPVVDGTQVIGIISQADVAKELAAAEAGELVETISEAPPNS